MGVYNPRAKMPNWCGDCDSMLEGTEECEICTIKDLQMHKRNDDCPLIDIVRCGECIYYKESEYIKGDMVCKYHMGHTYYTEADRFCYYGERRSE